MITRVEDISCAYWPLVHLFGWSVVTATGIVLVRFSGCLLAARPLDICCYLFVHQYFFLNLVSPQYFDPPGNHTFLTKDVLSSFACVFSFSSLLDRCEWPKLRVLWFPSWYFLTHCIFEDHLLELSSSEQMPSAAPPSSVLGYLAATSSSAYMLLILLSSSPQRSPSSCHCVGFYPPFIFGLGFVSSIFVLCIQLVISSGLSFLHSFQLYPEEMQTKTFPWLVDTLSIYWVIPLWKDWLNCLYLKWKVLLCCSAQCHAHGAFNKYLLSALSSLWLLNLSIQVCGNLWLHFILTYIRLGGGKGGFQKNMKNVQWTFPEMCHILMP